MNQDEVKEKLLAIEEPPLDFTLIFSGKKSKKANGLYKPESREIIIHNRNFRREDEKNTVDDNLLLYTAIHEYAHHLHSCSRGGKLSVRSHTADFWAIFHGLLEKAEERGIYQNVFAGSPELAELTELIRKKYLAENGSLVRELGRLLLQAHELCGSVGGRFEDYIDRVLRIPRNAANMAVKMYQYNLNPQLGADNMRFLAGIRNDETRKNAESSLLEGKSPDTVRVEAGKKHTGEAPAQKLEKEKLRLERTIESLTRRLEEVKKELGEAP
jgi:hypothetical protein